jgi:glutamate N-acetyltransferase/amino-acid N-acetyltransferase
MAKTDWKAEAKALRKKVRKLRGRVETTLSGGLEAMQGRMADGIAQVQGGVAGVVAAGKPVSPLAPIGGFPKLPIIPGVAFSAAEAGVKYKNRKDVMLIHLAPGTAMAGVFTRSSTRSACVRDCQEKLAATVRSGSGAAIIVNSGNSNAFTGKVGEEAVAAVTDGIAKALGIISTRVFSSSTGVIGEPLPYDRITAAIPDLVAGLSDGAIEMAAHAMMTTDTFPKGAAAVVQGDGGPIHIAGIAKGSGMIAPDMATMLVYIFTDAKIRPNMLQKMLSRNVDATFNSITVDSDTSTSDTLLLAATGQSKAADVK